MAEDECPWPVGTRELCVFCGIEIILHPTDGWMHIQNEMALCDPDILETSFAYAQPEGWSEWLASQTVTTDWGPKTELTPVEQLQPGERIELNVKGNMSIETIKEVHDIGEHKKIVIFEDGFATVQTIGDSLNKVMES